MVDYSGVPSISSVSQTNGSRLEADNYIDVALVTQRTGIATLTSPSLMKGVVHPQHTPTATKLKAVENGIFFSGEDVLAFSAPDMACAISKQVAFPQSSLPVSPRDSA